MTFKRLLANINLANQLTFLRLVATPFFILAVLRGRFDLALAIFGAAAVTDLLDGLTARLFKTETPLGAYLDPAADKILTTAAFLLLTEYPSLFRSIPMTVRIPVWLTVLTISRDVFIVSVALMLYLAYGATKFKPTVWGKATTLCESACVGLFLLCNQLEARPFVLKLMCWTTLVLILISGFDYLRRTVRKVGGKDPTTRSSR